MIFSAKPAIILGTTAPPLPWPRVRLTPEQQKYHATIWGITGSGKSKLLESIFLQHLAQGHGVGIIEPHHDLSFDSLSYLLAQGFFKQEDAYRRLIYIDWGNGYFVPFNILASGQDPKKVAYHALEGHLRVWPELREGPLYQTLFLSAVTALAINHLPITALYFFLSHAQFRAACLRNVADPLIHQVFAEFDRLGRDQAVQAGSTLRRAFLLSYSDYTRYTLGQAENWLNFRRLMDEGRSFILNLGKVQEEESRRLIGALLMVAIEQAALSRTDQLSEARKPFTLIVDEWPAFAAQQESLGIILSQARKFGLRLYLSAQSLSQITSKVRLLGALENCRLTINFALGRDSAEVQARHLGMVDPLAVKEEPLTETQHAQYLTIQEQFEVWTQQLTNLDPRYALVKLTNQPPKLMRTLNLARPKVDPEELEKVLATYRRLYQRRKSELYPQSPSEVEDVIERVGLPPRATSRAVSAYTKLFDGMARQPWPDG